MAPAEAGDVGTAPFWYYVDNSGAQQGPFVVAHMHSWHAAGYLLPTTKMAASYYGEVPDEFQDPITADLMHDPVKLPSGHSVDRPTITRHLLSDETDPFSRARLTIEMLKPNVELKEKIDAWLKERKGGGGGAAASSSGTAPMETG